MSSKLMRCCHCRRAGWHHINSDGSTSCPFCHSTSKLHKREVL